MEFTQRLIAATGLALLGSMASAAGPNDFYYLTSGDTLWRVAGLGDAAVPTHTGNEYNIAVSGDIRTTSQRNTSPGAQYGINGVYTGTDYPGTWLGFFDGTSDGTSNYTLDWDTGDVYQFDRNWANGNVIFNAGGGAGGHLGITYDPSNNSLWVSGWNTNVVENKTMGGALISAFVTPFTDITCLGMDHTDGTLWMGSQTTLGSFYQYNTAGGFLQQADYADLRPVNTLGGEFNTVPEPCTLALLAIGAAGTAFRARRRR